MHLCYIADVKWMPQVTGISLNVRIAPLSYQYKLCQRKDKSPRGKIQSLLGQDVIPLLTLPSSLQTTYSKNRYCESNLWAPIRKDGNERWRRGKATWNKVEHPPRNFSFLFLKAMPLSFCFCSTFISTQGSVNSALSTDLQTTYLVLTLCQLYTSVRWHVVWMSCA